MSGKTVVRPDPDSMQDLLRAAGSIVQPRNTVIVYGPPGCGMRMHAEALADHYGLALIVFDWTRPRNGDVPKQALVLATGERPRGPFSTPVEIVRYADAIAAIHDTLAGGQ